MGEIQEATQILRVSFEGIEIFMKIIGEGYILQKISGKSLVSWWRWNGYTEEQV